MVLKFIVLMTLMFFGEWCKMRHTIKSTKNATKEKKMTVINRIQAIHSWCETKSNVHCSSNSNVLFSSISLACFFLSLLPFSSAVDCISCFYILFIYLLETFFLFPYRCCFRCRRGRRRRCHRVFFFALYLILMLQNTSTFRTTLRKQTIQSLWKAIKFA